MVITDSLPAQTTYQSAFGVFEGGTVAASVCSGGTNTGTYAAPTVTGNLGSIAASATKTVYFRATIKSKGSSLTYDRQACRVASSPR